MSKYCIPIRGDWAILIDQLSTNFFRSTYFLLLAFFPFGKAFTQPTIPTVQNRCISLFECVQEDILTNASATSWNSTFLLSDGLDATHYTTKETGNEVPIWFEIPITIPSTNQLILAWRSFAFKNRNDAYRSLQDFTIEIRNNGIWTPAGQYTSTWKDSYVIFDIDPNSPPDRIRVTELQNNELYLARLDIYEKAPPGERDDIWLFLGDSETKIDMSTIAMPNFSDSIRAAFPCQYPIVINGGFGGEMATEMDDDNNEEGNLTAILNDFPDITFVALNYGLNDIMIGNLTPFGVNPSGNTAFLDAMESMIDKVNGTPNNWSGRIVIPSRIPWVVLPNNYCPSCSGLLNPFNSGDPAFPQIDFLDNVIASKTPYAVDPATQLAYADFATWYEDNQDVSGVFANDLVHHGEVGIGKFNEFWIAAATEILYKNSCTNSQYCGGDQTIINEFTCDPNLVGTVIQNLTNTAGNDSTVLIITTLLESDSLTINLSTCDENQVGSSIQNLTNTAGCDSIITTITSLSQPISTTFFLTTCEEEQVGTSVQNLTNNAGCDSIVTTITSYLQSDSLTINQNTCDLEQVGTSVQNLTNNAGCDSIVITITNLAIPTGSITSSSSHLIANPGNMLYQWVDCNDDFSIITDATEQIYSPLANGNYAVIISNETCSDTTLCVEHVGVGIEDLKLERYTVFPNPASDILTISTNKFIKKLDFQLTNNLGQIIRERTVFHSKYFTIQLKDLNKGVYFLHLFSDGKQHVHKIIKE